MSDKVLNNVPRELLERVTDSSRDRIGDADFWRALEELRALLTEQPQASAGICVCGEPDLPGIHRNDAPCDANLPQASAAQSAPAGEREAAIKAAYAAVVEGGWSSVKELGIEMFQAGAAW